MMVNFIKNREISGDANVLRTDESCIYVQPNEAKERAREDENGDIKMKKSQGEFKQGNWPEEYPNRLRKVSWCMDTSDGAVCGVLPYYNRHMEYSVKNDQCFIIQVLYAWFWKNGCGVEVCDKICQYFCKSFKVWYKEGDEGFTITYKKDKETGKPLFNEEKWMKVIGYCGADAKKEAKKLLTGMLKEVKRFYDQLLKMQIEEVMRIKSKRG